MVVVDLRDTERLAPHVEQAELLFNLAGQTSHLDSMENPFADLELNCSAQLCSSCRAQPRRAHRLRRTRQVYGRPQSLPVSEEHPIDPVDVNGIHKLAPSGTTCSTGRCTAPFAVLRLTNTYGPACACDARQTFLGVWIKRLTGERLRVFSDGTQRRDFTYVDDAPCALARRSRRRGGGLVLNVGSRGRISLLDLRDGSST